MSVETKISRHTCSWLSR